MCRLKQVSGGKVLYTKTRPVKNRVATALRMGAHCLHHANNYLEEFFRRMRRKLGAAEAVTATAHNLARILYHVLQTKEAYSESVSLRHDYEAIKRAENRLRKQAAELGFQLAPKQTDEA